ncbi:MAG: hypothetical protein IJM44_02685 [Ruminococcus sp.]|nr:hypothetical protein [Ruminococcus sp.]
MKKYLLAVLLFTALIPLSACTLEKSSEPSSYSEIPTADEQDYVRYDSELYSIDVPADWEQDELDGKVCFRSADQQQGLIFGELIKYGSQSPEYFFDVTAEQNDGVCGELSDTVDDPNGVKYRFGSYWYMDNRLAEMIICEDKHFILIISAQASDDTLMKDTMDILVHMAEKIEFAETEDMITGRSFESSSYGGNEIRYDLGEDGRFRISDRENSYISGSYELLRGMEAVERVAGLEEYGLTEDEQLDTVYARDCFLDDYYALIFFPQKTADEDEGRDLDDGILVLYVGNYCGEGSFDITNCNSATNELWKEAEE